MESKKSKQKITYKYFFEELAYLFFIVIVVTVVYLLCIVFADMTRFLTPSQLRNSYYALMIPIFLIKLGIDLYDEIE